MAVRFVMLVNVKEWTSSLKLVWGSRDRLELQVGSDQLELKAGRWRIQVCLSSKESEFKANLGNLVRTSSQNVNTGWGQAQ